MNTFNLSDSQRRIRSAVRNFLFTASLEELQRELEISQDKGDTFRAKCVQELINEESK